MKTVGISENLRGALNTDLTLAEKLSVAAVKFHPGSTPWHVACEAIKVFTELAEHYELTIEEFLAASSVLAGGCAATLVAEAKEEGAVPLKEDSDGEEYADYVEAFMDLTIYQTISGMIRTGTIPMALTWTPVGLRQGCHPKVELLEVRVMREDDGSEVVADVRSQGDPGTVWKWGVTFDTGESSDFTVTDFVEGSAETREQAIAAAEAVIKHVAIVPPGGIDTDYARKLGEAVAREPVQADQKTT